MKVKRLLAWLLTLALLLSVTSVIGCAKNDAATEEPAAQGAAEAEESTGPDYDNMSMDELYELAKLETGTITIYSTTTTAQIAVKINHGQR